MREEGFVGGTEDVRLTIEILVPSTQVGRIIGKGGQNVRELQRVTGSIIKLSEQQSTSPSADEEATVQIIGPFFSVQVLRALPLKILRFTIVKTRQTKYIDLYFCLFSDSQSAQRRIRAMVLQSSGAPGAGVAGSRAGRGSSQEGGSRTRRDGSATSQQGGTASQHSAQQQSSTSPSNQQQSQNQ